MTYLDIDITNTDWSDFGQQNEAERCPVTGVPTALVYGPAVLRGDKPVDSRPERAGRSKSKLQVMYDKFLYQK